jgi:hypothetical protein
MDQRNAISHLTKLVRILGPVAQSLLFTFFCSELEFRFRVLNSAARTGMSRHHSLENFRILHGGLVEGVALMSESFSLPLLFILLEFIASVVLLVIKIIVREKQRYYIIFVTQGIFCLSLIVGTSINADNLSKEVCKISSKDFGVCSDIMMVNIEDSQG